MKLTHIPPKNTFALFLCGLAFSSLTSIVDAQLLQKAEEQRQLTEQQIDHLGITNPDKLSAATKRALKWPRIGNEWFVQFQVQDLKGDLAYEEGIVRRDPR